MVQKKEPLLCQAEVPMNKGYLVPEVPGTNEQAKSQPNNCSGISLLFARIKTFSI